MASTVDFLIYALGGGHGHARRGLLLQQHLASRGVASVVLLCPGSDRYFPAYSGPRIHVQSLDEGQKSMLMRNPPPYLVVDTFPQGWRSEIDRFFLARFAKKFWIARYSKNIEEPPLGFDKTLVPYPKGLDEWDRAWQGELLRRPGALRLSSA